MTTPANPQDLPRLYITDREVMEVLGISQPTLWRWTKDFGFPKTIKDMKGRRSYKEFMEWLAERGMV